MKYWIVTVNDCSVFCPLYKRLIAKFPNRFIGCIEIEEGYRVLRSKGVGKVEYLLRFFGLKELMSLMALYVKYRVLNKDLLKDECDRHELKHYKVKSLDEACKILKRYKAGKVLCTVRQIVKKEHFMATSSFWINTHFGLLPENKGIYIPFWDMVKNKSLHGVTIHRMDEKFDNGLIVSRQRLSLSRKLSLHEVVDKLGELALLMHEYELERHHYKKANFNIRLHKLSNYYSHPKIKDGIRFRNKGREFVN